MNTHLTKRGSVYYFRRKVPLDLIAVYGKAEIMFSLGTKDRSVANPLARKFGVQYDEEFAEARRNALQTPNASPTTSLPIVADPIKPKLSDGLTIEHFDVLVTRFVTAYRKRREVAAADPKQFEQFRNNLHGHRGILEEHLATAVHPLETLTRPLWHIEAELKAIEVVLDGKSFVSVALPPTPLTATPIIQLEPVVTVASLDSILSRWAKERKPDPRTITYFERVVSTFKEYTGISDGTQIKKSHIVLYKDKLLESGTTTVTTNTYLSNLSTLLNYGVTNAILEHNHAQGFKVQVDDKDKIVRVTYALNELSALFNSAVYTENYRPKAGGGEAAYWLPLVALFSGARLTELCQLHKKEIYQEAYYDRQGAEHQCWVIAFTEETEGHKLKNEKSIRRIPVHPTLIELGFIEFVQQSPGPRVFHELTPAMAYGSISANWSKWYGRYLKRIGIKKPGLDYHSFRHTFKFYARMHSISINEQNALLGHSGGTVGETYGGSVYPLAPLVEAMSKYHVPHLRLPGRP